MNELALIFDKLGISTSEVLEAAGTKWNFLRFTPGLVGGHCIGIDPYYLTYKAESIGYYPQVILSGRRINDGMGKYIAETTVKKMIEADKPVKGSRVLVLGLTFKENVPDIRNTRVIDIIEELRSYGVEPLVHDPMANTDETHHEYGINLIDLEGQESFDAVVYAVPHAAFESFDAKTFAALCKGRDAGRGTRDAENSKSLGVVIDVKSQLNRDAIEAEGLIYWAL
jgi:UDP-N-acetyl-D-galactosamine dehydrogenase